MDATDVWDIGHPLPSLKAEILSHLRQHDDEMFEIAALRDEMFDVTIPDTFSDTEGIIDYGVAIQKQAVVEQTLEELVDEEKVEKRLFVRNTAGAIADVVPDEQYDDAYEYVERVATEANLQQEVEIRYYRISQDD
jgi:hypothetical protein